MFTDLHNAFKYSVLLAFLHQCKWTLNVLIAGNPDLGEQYCGYVTSSFKLADYDCTETGPYICETRGKYPLFTHSVQCLLSQWPQVVSNYRPPTKLREGNAFTPVCQFTEGG